MNRSHVLELSIAEIRSSLIPHIQQNGYSSGEARLVLEELIESELLGKPDYGLVNLPRLLEYDRSRERSPMRVVTNAAVTTIDGGGRLAQTLVPEVTRIVRDAVADRGVHVVGINNVTTLLRAASLTYPLCRHGLVAICFVFTNIAISKTPAMGAPGLGVNLLSIAVPGDETPLVYDASLAAMPLGKLRRAAESHRTAHPQPLGLDEEDRETREPDRVRHLMPIAGDRGFGLSLATQLLAGAMLGFETVEPVERYAANNGFMVVALDPGRFGDTAGFRGRVQAWMDGLRAQGKCGFRIPGEAYQELERRRRETTRLEVPSALMPLLANRGDGDSGPVRTEVLAVAEGS
jgi:ureidoglycolate dehydrogenase (NAD+)